MHWYSKYNFSCSNIVKNFSPFCYTWIESDKTTYGGHTNIAYLVHLIVGHEPDNFGVLGRTCLFNMTLSEESALYLLPVYMFENYLHGNCLY